MGDNTSRRDNSSVISGSLQGNISGQNGRTTFVDDEYLSPQMKDQVYHQLIDMFVEVLEPNIIQDVMQNRNYDFYGALEDLMTLTNSTGCHKDKQSSPREHESSISPEKTSSEGESSCSPPSCDNASVRMSQSLDAIKVSYTNLEEENVDADVIIEEENEFVFLKDEVKTNGSLEINSSSEIIRSNVKSLSSLLTDVNNITLNQSKEKRSVDSQSDKEINKLKLNQVLEQYQLIKKIPNAFDRIVMLIKENFKIMVLMRGCPGSGKSHLATTIMMNTPLDVSKYKEHILSTDEFFKLGKEYVFNPEKLSEAHAWNQRRVLEALRINLSPIIVDNTNTQSWEMKPYVTMAVTQGYDLEILEPETWWSFNDNELAKKNIHHVPKKSIRNMLDRYERNITAESLLRYFGLQYSLSNAPPQLLPNLTPTSNSRKRGCRGKRNKKAISNLISSSGLPDLGGSTMMPSALPQELHSFEVNPGSNIFNDLCTYYKSLHFDKSSHKEEQGNKTKENCDVLNSNFTKQTRKQKFVADSNTVLNHSSLPSFSGKFNENACGYTPTSNNQFITPSRQELKEQKQPKSCNPFKVLENEHPNCFQNNIETVNDNKGDSFLGHQDLKLVGENGNKLFNQTVDKLSLKDKQNDPGELIEKLVKGELQENEIINAGSVLNSLVNLNAAADNISVVKDKTPIKQLETNQDFFEKLSKDEFRNQENDPDLILSYPYTMQSLIQSLTRNEIEKENKEVNSVSLSKSERNSDQQSIQTHFEELSRSNITDEKEEFQNDVYHKFCPFTVNRSLDENVICREDKKSEININNAQICPEVSFNKEINNENMCRQFIMYTSEGFIYSDPICNSLSVEGDNETKCNNSGTSSSVSSKLNINSFFDENNDKKVKASINSSANIVDLSMNCDFAKEVETFVDCKKNQGSIGLHYNVSDDLNFDEINPTSANILNECSEISKKIINSEVISNIDSECKIENVTNTKNNAKFETNEILIQDKDNINESNISNLDKPLEPQINISFYSLGSNSDGPVLPVVEEQLPQIDLMSLFLGNNSSHNSSSSPEIVTSPTPKSPRLNTRKRTPTDSTINYPIAPVEISPDVALWDTVNDPLSLWNSSNKNNTITPDEELNSNEGSKPQREFIKKGNRVKLLEVMDSSTNTSYTDFDLKLTKSDSNNESVLLGKNRNICEGIVANPIKNNSTVLLLDKGTMAVDLNHESKIDFDEFVSLFPQLQGEALNELVEKCQGDLNWAVDLLLDSDQLSLPERYQTAITNINLTSKQMDKDQDTNKVNLNMSGVRKKNPKYDKNPILKESRLELKELIERNIVLSESHYSDHVLKIMKRRRDVNKKEDCNNQKAEKKSDNSCEGNVSMNEEQVATIGMVLPNPDKQNSGNNIWNEKQEEAVKGLPLPSQDIQNLCYNVGNEKQEEDEEDDDEEDDLVQLAVGKDLIIQLQQKFGWSLLPDMMEDSSLIELPMSLACQLHSYIIESIQRQSELQQDIMDTMIREDEEFARQLQQQEDDLEQKNEEKPAPLLQEIMDMEMALAFYKADQDEWRQQSQNTMAAKLSMQILTQSFPKLDKNVLTDIFHSNNCSLHDTVASLNLALADEQPDLIRKEEELLAKLETAKLQEPERSAIVVTDARDSLNPQQEAEEYRNQAACYYELRNNCFKKAQEAFRSGNTSVASYYSQLAALHKKRTEFFNSQAAACLFHARPKSSTLDLHFLHVAEAVQVLDIFLDEEIANLNHRKKKKSLVFLITGRGLRSVGGVSRIKPIVQRRLRERKIIYNEMNPGMLNAVLTRNTQLTCNI